MGGAAGSRQPGAPITRLSIDRGQAKARPPERVAGVYAEATSLLRPGGVLVNTETIPDLGLPSLAGELERIIQDRGAQLRAAGGVPTWSQWWEQLRLDPVLAGPTAERDERFRLREA